MEKFFDTRKHKPQKGQVLASFRASAEFVDGLGKRDIINLLKTDKSHQAVQLMKKAHCVVEPDCYRICREIAEDLLTMTDEEVEKKSYEMVVNYTFWAKKEDVPTDDPRWSMLPVVEFDKDRNTFVSKIEF